jgi:hypothetical protein
MTSIGLEGTQTFTTKPGVAQVAPAAVVAPPVGLPPEAVIDACNQQAAQAAPQGKTTEIVKDGAIGALVGAAVGAVGGAIVDGGSGADEGAVIGGGSWSGRRRALPHTPFRLERTAR